MACFGEWTDLEGVFLELRYVVFAGLKNILLVCLICLSLQDTNG